MIFRSLTLENFGTYSGRHRLALSPGVDRPVILIGGSNGAGKTTVLEALLLCLHGRRAVGRAMSIKDYERHVAARIHMPPEGSSVPDHASLTLVLEHSEGATPAEYVVERSWRRGRGGGVRERLFLAKDGSPVDDLPESAWQDFLDGLLPPGIADLFLFDGERIQDLAEDESGEQLGDAVRRLLGLDVVGQLRSDLARYAAKKADKAADALADVFVEQERVLRAAEGRVRALRDEHEQTQLRRDEVADRAAREHERFAQQGGVLAEERAELESRVRVAAEKEQTATAEVREMAAALLPFAICPELAGKVVDRLNAEELEEEDDVVRRRLSEARFKLSRRLSVKSTNSSLARVLEEILLSDDRGLSDAKRIHDLTPAERAALIEQLSRVRSKVPTAAKRVARRLRRATEERARSAELLAKVPEASAISHLLVELQRLEREVGSLDAELERLDQDLHRAKYEVTVADREAERARDALGGAHDADHRSGLAVRAASALEEFEAKMQAGKLRSVELETARYFNRLSGKGELLSLVQIDPGSFRISLRRWDGTELPKQRLSAGEKQLLAISLLWALAWVSGRPLPVVIDTPLARLDRAHRQKLLREYFPRVSHQVIVLSTDTEVDAAAAQELAPVTARSFHLDHDASSCQTTVNVGYFFPMSELVDAR